LIYEDKEHSNYFFKPQVSNDGKYLILDTCKNVDDLNIITYAKIHGPIEAKLTFKPLITEWVGGFYYIHNVGSKMYFRTNYNASNCRVVMIDIDHYSELNQIQDCIPENSTNVLHKTECGNEMIVA